MKVARVRYLMALRNILELSHLGIDFPETAKLFKKANAAEARSHLVLRVVPRRICHSNSGTTGAGASPHGPACDLQLRLCEVVGG